jgi:hypothetical protein
MRQYFAHFDKERRKEVEKVATILYTSGLNNWLHIVETDRTDELKAIDGVTGIEPADTGNLCLAY